jgi:hypothetical protein
MRTTLGLAVAAWLLLAAPAANASVLRVDGGVLSIEQAAGEATRVSLSGNGDIAFGNQSIHARYSPHALRWPGAKPGPGPGCVTRCMGVTRIDLGFGAADDSALVTLSRPPAGVRLSGGEGRDGLAVESGATAELDGGPGDDVLALGTGSAAGGDGDDFVLVTAGGPVAIDCGPGQDAIRREAAGGGGNPRDTARIDADAASCPPVLTPIIKLGLYAPGKNPVFHVPPSRKVTVPVFRATEAVKGRMTLRRPRNRGPCAGPVRFSAAAGKPVKVTLTLTQATATRVAALGRGRSVQCILGVKGTDPQGERFTGDEAPDEPDAFGSYAILVFVSSKTPLG